MKSLQKSKKKLLLRTLELMSLNIDTNLDSIKSYVLYMRIASVYLHFLFYKIVVIVKI